MFIPEKAMFAFTLRENGAGTRLEGLSDRYTAISLLGISTLPDGAARGVLHGLDPMDVCGEMIARVVNSDELGEVALALWAARVLRHPDADRALLRLCELTPDRRPCPTVELAWSLSAQVAPGSDVCDAALATRTAERLMDSFHAESDLFSHWPRGGRASRLRGHVACFADMVYPVQALSYYYQYTSHSHARSRSLALACARKMCALQGPAGQWWWHFDVRTGSVVERFPIYSVHQDAMAPMALAAVREATGEDDGFSRAAQLGLRWLALAPELAGESLVDESTGVIWRKVHRHEPGRFVRGAQALLSGASPKARLPLADTLFPPGRIDRECRPYHMGWVLVAWPGASHGSESSVPRS